MKTRKLLLALIILLVLVIMQGQAGAFFFTSGNKLVESMREWEKGNVKDPSTNYFYSGHYAGYVTGVSDAVSGILVEYQQGITGGQICAIVAKYLKNHPEMWNEPAADLVIKALKEAFPLKK